MNPREKKEASKATFGAGCFWHVEEAFRTQEGVIDTKVGFMGGIINDPTYAMVSTSPTNHAEVVQIVYDSKKTSYAHLLNIFWKNHNPTHKNRQGFDIGTQYRSIIFFYNKDQKKTAIKSLKEEQKRYDNPIQTKIVPAEIFYPAEEYHQKYLMKKGLRTCPV